MALFSKKNKEAFVTPLLREPRNRSGVGYLFCSGCYK